MTPSQVGLLALLPLAALLLAVAWHDVKRHRIPNALVFGGAAIGLALNGLLPQGLGFNSTLPGGLGWLASLQGLGLGLALLLPLYWLRVMGAGDAKLMAMVGAFIGPQGVLGALLAAFLAGGVMALALALRAGALGRLLQNLRLMLIEGMVKVSAGQAPVMDGPPVSVGKLPYSVAIAAGTLGYLAWQRMG